MVKKQVNITYNDDSKVTLELDLDSYDKGTTPQKIGTYDNGGGEFDIYDRSENSSQLSIVIRLPFERLVASLSNKTVDLNFFVGERVPTSVTLLSSNISSLAVKSIS